MATLNQVSLTIPDNSLPGRTLSATAEIAKTQLAQQTLQPEPIPFALCRVWDAMQTNTPGTPATDDLGLVTGTPGTDAPMLSDGDLKAAGATTRKVAFEMSVPYDYDDGETFEVRFTAGMETSVADVSATIDLQVFKPDGTGAVGSDLCTTAAQSINSLTPNDYDFTIDGSGIDPGDKLICIVSVAVNDAATATAVTAAIYGMTRRCDTRG